MKTLFVPVLGGEVSKAALQTAATLATANDAHVVSVICISAMTPVVAAWVVPPMADYDTLGEAAEAAASDLSKAVDGELARAGVSHETHVSNSVWMTTSEIASLHARYCDLVVLGRMEMDEARLEGEFFADILLHSGRPVLVVPRMPLPERSGRAVVAWKPTREASRAVHDALPLLRASTSVQVLVVEPKVGTEGHGELPGADIAAHLTRHGLAVEVVQCPRAGAASAGAALLRHAEEQGADLLVAGGYGHRRMRQMVFGGVTRTLFEQTRVPVLFSH